MTRFTFLFACIVVLFPVCLTQQAIAQPGQKTDTAKVYPKTVKGPNHGKMIRQNGVQIEMLTPANTKKPGISYFLFDTLGLPVAAGLYTGTVKFVFGGPNQYIEVPLLPGGKSNQYSSSLEDWKECKEMIITLKASGKIAASVAFLNTVPVKHWANDTQSPPGTGRQNGNGMMGNGMR